ncbi:hypothetical protein QQS21_005385 [Conoideocrella luteorostrata]|uniref:TNT domain-containing protein n=1 Tax=Conoideocrella luteorostrata TaxID=1105319 RepID=A0AAJ0CQJ5_9HYPO|nr:hypothetical protein QQS21_005385 [Conoideocrella luteorostrata]
MAFGFTKLALALDCKGAKNNVTLAEDYICGDDRLGPIKYGTKAVMEGSPSITARIMDCFLKDYDPLHDMKPVDFLQKFWDKNAQPKPTWRYPDYDGFEKDKTTGKYINSSTIVPSGSYLDRFGWTKGSFLAIAGTSYTRRSIPPDSLNPYPPYPLTSDNRFSNYHVYLVEKNFTANGGLIAPWFGQNGYSGQLKIEGGDVQSLIDSKMIQKVDPKTAWDNGAYGHCPGAPKPPPKKAPPPPQSQQKIDWSLHNFFPHIN